MKGNYCKTCRILISGKRGRPNLSGLCKNCKKEVDNKDFYAKNRKRLIKYMMKRYNKVHNKHRRALK